MTSNVDESTTSKIYELTCTDCAFETTVMGSLSDVLDVADAHQNENGETSTKHFVNCELDTTDE